MNHAYGTPAISNSCSISDLERYQAYLVVCAYARDVYAIRATFAESYASQLIYSLRQPRYSLVHTAVMVGDTATLCAVVDSLPSDVLNVQDESGRTPLMYAATLGHTSDIQLLMGANASASVVDSDGCSALILAAQSGRVNAIRALLIDRNINRYRTSVGLSVIDMQDNQGDTALMHAVRGGHYEATEALLHYGSDVNLANKSGERALSVAIASGFLRLVKLLCTNERLDINAADMRGVTALMHAATYASKTYDSSILNFLLKNHADTEAKDVNGDTVVLREAKSGSGFAIEHLIFGGARWDTLDVKGCCAISLAAQHNNISALTYFLTFADICVDKKDEKGRTPLFYAIAGNYEEITYELIKRGADISLCALAVNEPLRALVTRTDNEELANFF